MCVRLCKRFYLAINVEWDRQTDRQTDRDIVVNTQNNHELDQDRQTDKEETTIHLMTHTRCKSSMHTAICPSHLNALQVNHTQSLSNVNNHHRRAVNICRPSLEGLISIHAQQGRAHAVTSGATHPELYIIWKHEMSHYSCINAAWMNRTLHLHTSVSSATPQWGTADWN